MQIDFLPIPMFAFSVIFIVTNVVLALTRGIPPLETSILTTVFGLYMIFLLDATLMPLPLSRDAVGPHEAENILIPGLGIIQFLTSPFGLQTGLLNLLRYVAMFLPLGFLAPFLWPWMSVGSALKLGLSFAGAIEIIRGGIGILLQHNYQSVMVDNVILAAVGTLLGYSLLILWRKSMRIIP